LRNKRDDVLMQRLRREPHGVGDLLLAQPRQEVAQRLALARRQHSIRIEDTVATRQSAGETLQPAQRCEQDVPLARRKFLVVAVAIEREIHLDLRRHDARAHHALHRRRPAQTR
jgi:hypothetical protein